MKHLYFLPPLAHFFASILRGQLHATIQNNGYVEHRGSIKLMLSYYAPIFPVDLICVGTVRVKVKN